MSETQILQPTDWQPIGNKALTMIVAFGTATLRGGIPVEDCQKLPRLAGKARQAAMNAIVGSMKTNKHLEQEEGQRCLAGAAALALSSQAGDVLRELGFAGAILTYTITPLATPNDYNWRLAVEPGACHS